MKSSKTTSIYLPILKAFYRLAARFSVDTTIISALYDLSDKARVQAIVLKIMKTFHEPAIASQAHYLAKSNEKFSTALWNLLFAKIVVTCAK